MLLLVTILPNLLISFISIGLVTGLNRRFFEIIFRYPAMCFLPAVTYFVIGPMQIGCCRKTPQIGLSKILTIINLLVTCMMYVTINEPLMFYTRYLDSGYFGYIPGYFGSFHSFVFAPVCCTSIIFTAVYLLLDTKCCFSGSQACFCLCCCGPDLSLIHI